MAVLVLSGPENFAKREKLRRNLVMSGRLVILKPDKDVQKYNILSGRVVITFHNSLSKMCKNIINIREKLRRTLVVSGNSFTRQICQRCGKI